jgi:hypothetical protein
VIVVLAVQLLLLREHGPLELFLCARNGPVHCAHISTADINRGDAASRHYDELGGLGAGLHATAYVVVLGGDHREGVDAECGPLIRSTHHQD